MTTNITNKIVMTETNQMEEHMNQEWLEIR